MDSSIKLKLGFGLLEIVVSMIVLALVSTSIMMLHYGNRMASLRIQMRNEATEIGQNILDSMSAHALSKLTPIVNLQVQGNERHLGTGAKTKRIYTVNASIVPHTVNQAVTIDGVSYGHEVNTRSEIVVKVSFPVANSTQSVELSTVVK